MSSRALYFGAALNSLQCSAQLVDLRVLIVKTPLQPLITFLKLAHFFLGLRQLLLCLFSLPALSKHKL